MNEYTVVFKKRFSGAEHRWVIKRTIDNFVVAHSEWFKSFPLCVADLAGFLNWMKSQEANG